MLRDLLVLLESQYGKPGAGAAGGPLDMILWENVLVLMNRERWNKSSGSHRVSRDRTLSKISSLVMELFNGDIRRLFDLPVDQATQALQLFPGIDRLGAERILMFSRRLPVLALDRDGLRVLLRLGYGKKCNSFETTYRCVQDAIQPHVIADYDWLIRAHQLLRIHGQELCRLRKPRCPDCPVRTMCAYARDRKL